MTLLNEAEDNYYITAKYLLDIANRAYYLFVRSEVEERRQLFNLVLQSLRLDDKTVRYDRLKPFDTILNYNDKQLGLPLVDMFRKKEVEVVVSLSAIKTFYSNLNLAL